MAFKNIFNNSWVVNILFLIVLLGVNLLINLQYEPISNTRLYLYQGVSLVFIYIMAALHNKYALQLLIIKRQYWKYLGVICSGLAVTTFVTYTLRVDVFKTDMDMLWVGDFV